MKNQTSVCVYRVVCMRVASDGTTTRGYVGEWDGDVSMAVRQVAYGNDHPSAWAPNDVWTIERNEITVILA